MMALVSHDSDRSVLGVTEASSDGREGVKDGGMKRGCLEGLGELEADLRKQQSMQSYFCHSNPNK
jgi:hypothetical protein